MGRGQTGASLGQPDLVNALREDIAQRRVAVVVGSGVSIATTKNAKAASWRGLLELGAQWCVQHGVDLPDDWLAHVQRDIRSPDLDDIMAAAGKITAKLNSLGAFARWLRETVGTLKIVDSDVIKAVVDLPAPLLTTNYDLLLEEATGRREISWRDPRKVERVLRGDDQAIVHLHGYWDDPESVILGPASYQHLADHASAQALQHAFLSKHLLLFIGCGEGINDPNFSAMRRWTREIFKHSEYWHYRLALSYDVESLQREHEPEERIQVLSYGNTHEDLPRFLASLIPPGLDRVRLVPPGHETPAAEGEKAILQNQETLPAQSVNFILPNRETPRVPLDGASLLADSVVPLSPTRTADFCWTNFEAARPKVDLRPPSPFSPNGNPGLGEPPGLAAPSLKSSWTSSLFSDALPGAGKFAIPDSPSSLPVPHRPRRKLSTILKGSAGAIGAWFLALVWGNENSRNVLYGVALALCWLFPPLLLFLVLRNKVKVDLANRLCLAFLVFGVIAIPTSIVLSVRCYSAGKEIEQIKLGLPGLQLTIEERRSELSAIHLGMADVSAPDALAKNLSDVLEVAQGKLLEANHALSSSKRAMEKLEEDPHTTGAMVLLILLGVVGLENLIFCLFIFAAANEPTWILPTYRR